MDSVRESVDESFLTSSQIRCNDWVLGLSLLRVIPDSWINADLVTHICPRCPEVATAGLFSETVNSVRVLSDMSGL